MRDTLPSVSSQRVFVLLSMLTGEIYLRLKSHVIVKISSHIVTEHCCRVCVLSTMFCRSDCRSCADMVSDCRIRKVLGVPRGLTPLRQANVGYEKYSLHLIFHILPEQRHIGARIISCRCISIKKILRVDPSKLSLKLCDCGRMIRNGVHIDTYYRKPKLISWW